MTTARRAGRGSAAGIKALGEFFYDENDRVVRWENSHVAECRSHAAGRALTVALNRAIKAKLDFPENVLAEAESYALAATKAGGNTAATAHLCHAILGILRYLRGEGA